jgi:hypothetical protein
MGVLQFSVVARSAKPFRLSQDHVEMHQPEIDKCAAGIKLSIRHVLASLKKPVWGTQSGFDAHGAFALARPQAALSTRVYAARRPVALDGRLWS